MNGLWVTCLEKQTTDKKAKVERCNKHRQTSVWQWTTVLKCRHRMKWGRQTWCLLWSHQLQQHWRTDETTAAGLVFHTASAPAVSYSLSTRHINWSASTSRPHNTAKMTYNTHTSWTIKHGSWRHFVFDHNSCVYWASCTLFVPVKREMYSCILHSLHT